MAEPAAMHDSGEVFDRPKCHEDTRVAVLKRFTDWILGNLFGAACIMWLYGGAGAGKSTIAQTLAQWSAERSMLLGSFFFSRSDPRRSHHTSLVPTFIYQAVVACPALKSHVFASIERDPLIFNKSIHFQFDTLLIRPLNAIYNLQPAATVPHVIIIDGLDECTDSEQQHHVLDVLSDAVQKCKAPLKVLVVSRPEVEIKGAFNCDPLQTLSGRVALDNSQETNTDIRRFLVYELKKLKKKHQLQGHLPDSWPDENLMDELVKRASGQFIYASTVVKYITSLRHHPVERLEIILGLRINPSERDLPFVQLDALFWHIFSSIPPHDRELVMTIIGALVVDVASHYLLRSIQGLAEFFALPVARVELLLGNLTSIVKIHAPDFHKGGVRASYIEVLHASLSDFLLDKQRSKEFYLDSNKVSADLLRICMKNLNMGGKHRRFSLDFAARLDRSPPVLDRSCK